VTDSGPSLARAALLRGVVEAAAKVPGGRRMVFDLYHRRNVWNGRASKSGVGSDPEQTAVVRAALPGLLRRLDVTSMADVPCGDLTWIRHVDLGLDQYVGIDIVPAMIRALKQAPPIPNAEFHCMDVVNHPVPPVDAVFCRDLLVHLSYDEIWRVLRNLRASGAGWLITTTFPGRTNFDIRAGMWRGLNLQAPPFEFPEPEELILESDPDSPTGCHDKSLGVWDFASLSLGRRQ
jgi:SAM-dependent methyltransferase